MSGGITDRNVGFLRKEVYYPVQTAETFLLTSGTPNTITSQESSTSLLGVITGTKIVAGLVSVANDGFDWAEKIPGDLDYHRSVGIRPVFTKDATGGTHVTSMTWTAKFGHIGSKGTIATGATALTTAIGADTQMASADSLKLYIGNRGIIKGDTFLPTDYLWTWRMQLTAFTASGSDLMWLLGIIIDYMPHYTIGKGAEIELQLRTNPLGATWGQNGG